MNAKQRKRMLTGRLGAPTNLRPAGVMESANRLKDVKRLRAEAKRAVRRGDWE